MIKVLHLNSNYAQSNVHYMLVTSLNEYTSLQGRVFFPCRKKGSMVYFNQNEFNSAAFLEKHACLYDFERYLYRLRNLHFMSVLCRTTEVAAYDILFAHSLFSNGFLALSAAKKFKIPYILFVTSTDIERYFKKRPFLRGTGIEILANAHLIFFSSSASCEKLISRYLPMHQQACIKMKSHVIPFGLDDFWLEHKSRKCGAMKEHKIRLLYVGKITERKNILFTVQACERLIKAGYQISFTIVGDCERDTNITMMKRLKQYPFLSIKEYMPIHELLQEYRQNDIFVMPSVRESFGLVYAEALSQGLPVIYSEGEGFDGHFQNHDVGVAVNPFSVDEIVEAILYILAHYQAISERAYLSVEAFSWKTIARKMEADVIQALNGYKC